MEKIKKFCKMYYWILLLAFAIGGSWWLSIRAWDYLHIPIIIDSFWNDSLKMYEPIYAPPMPEWIHLFVLAPVIITMWWHSPFWFQPLYTISMIWLAWQIYIRTRAPY